MVTERPWIVAQVGARENYAIARVLHARRRLEALATDIWLPPGPFDRALPRRLRGRYHLDLRDAPVVSNVAAAIAIETAMKWNRRDSGLALVRRNAAMSRLLTALLETRSALKVRPVLFAYSYAAGSVLKFARKRGWMTMLGQIDPGPVEEKIVLGQYRTLYGVQAPGPELGPAYWAAWREEVELADRIVVNSEWSAACLSAGGVAAEKLRIVPLALDTGRGVTVGPKAYPVRFTAERPLRVLFLGQANVRKGIHIVYDAFSKLINRPVELTVIGNEQLSRPAALAKHGVIHWLGRVPRDEVDRHYLAADVFLLPTFSDGFALTQLEAQSWRLPIIASKCCGAVVKDGDNGILIDELSSEAIISAIERVLVAPELLHNMSQRSGLDPRFTFDGLWMALQEAAEIR